MRKPMGRIRITVNPLGDSSVAVSNLPGSDCKAATAELEAALGSVTEDKLTREYTQVPAATERATARA